MKNLKTIFFLLIILKSSAIFALGDKVSPKEIEEFYSNSDTKNSVLLYFGGLGDGIMWTDTLANEETICPPSDLVMSAEDYYSIYRTSYLREKDFFDSLEHQPPGLILLVGLQYDFPCD